MEENKFDFFEEESANTGIAEDNFWNTPFYEGWEHPVTTFCTKHQQNRPCQECFKVRDKSAEQRAAWVKLKIEKVGPGRFLVSSQSDPNVKHRVMRTASKKIVCDCKSYFYHATCIHIKKVERKFQWKKY